MASNAVQDHDRFQQTMFRNNAVAEAGTIWHSCSQRKPVSMTAEFQYDVFLSHSAKDKAVVRAVAERLRKDGLKVWFDEWVLPSPAGESYCRLNLECYLNEHDRAV